MHQLGTALLIQHPGGHCFFLFFFLSVLNVFCKLNCWSITRSLVGKGRDHCRFVPQLLIDLHFVLAAECHFCDDCFFIVLSWWLLVGLH